MAKLTALPGQTVEPPLVSDTNSKNIERAKLLSISVEDIEDTFRRGYIDAGQRNDVLRERARAVIDEMIADKGFFQSVLEKTIQGVQKGWDNLKESEEMSTKAEGVGEKLKADGLALWGSVQVLTSVFSAIGTVSGQQAERWALGAGASPGLARLINISVDVGSSFVPVGKATQLGAKGFQAVRKIGAKEVEVTAKAAAAKEAEQVATDAIEQAMKVEIEGSVLQEATTKAVTASEQFTQDFRRFLREMKDVTDPQSHAETARLAKELGLGLDDLHNVVPGRALNEREMFAYLKALEPQTDELIRLADIASKSDLEADVNAFAEKVADFFTIAPIFRGAEVTAGRSVEILKETPPMKKITDMLIGWDPESMAKGDFQSAIRTMAGDILQANRKELMATAIQSRTLWAQFKENMWPKIREVYYNILLPMAVIPNTFGNAWSMANSVAERSVGALFSADKAKGLVGQEGWFLIKGYTSAFGDGLTAFGKAFKGVAPGEASKLDYVPHQIPGIVGRIINIPADTLRGTDNFFRTLLRRGSYGADAIREGVHSGRSNSKSVIATEEYRAKFGNESLTEFVTRRTKFPTASMISEGDAFATHNTYQDQLGAIANKLRGIAQIGPMSLYFPFMKSPINLVKYAWDRTPWLQFISRKLYEDIAAGGPKADEAIARITIANMQGMFVYQMAQEGYFTGSGPVDPTLRRAWMATHQPYSIRSEGGWIPVTNFEPANTPFGLIADFAQIHNQLDEPSAEQLGMAATFSIMRGMLDKTWWRTMSDFVDITASIKEGTSISSRLRDVGLSPALTVLSGGPLAGAIRRAIDPVQRETRTLADSFMSRVPGYSKDVPPVRDAYGEPVLPPQNIAGPWLGIVAPIKEKAVDREDRVRMTGDSLKIEVPQFPWVLGGTRRDDFDIRAPMPTDLLGVELTPKQRDRAQEIYKGFLRDPKFGMEAQLLDTNYFNGLTPAGQREAFMDQLASYRKQAIETLSVEVPTIGAKMIESQARKLLPMLHRNEQEEFKRDTAGAMTLFYEMAPEMRENLLRWGSPPGED